MAQKPITLSYLDIIILWRVRGHFTGLRKLDVLSGISKVVCIHAQIYKELHNPSSEV